jgi:Flp pilus assembly protein TadG
MNMFNAKIVKSDRGQTLILYALIVPLLVLFAGLAIDVGILYVTKAKLSTSVDGATLTGMKTLTQGQTTAAVLATDVFNANYGANPPTPAVTFPTDSYGDQQVKVTATANVHTLFMRYLPQWAVVPVSDTAVATRGKLIMSIVLDRSGSMTSDGGESALVSAVPTFVSMFSNSTDEVALLSFSSNARIDFPIGYNFITPISTAVSTMKFVGGTFGTGGTLPTSPNNTIGPPMAMADAQNNSVTVLPGQNVFKVLVYFTDGLMNASQDYFYCGGAGNNTKTLINYGGYDAGTNDVAILDPTCSPDVSDNNCTNESGHISQIATCTNGCPTGFQYSSSSSNVCKNQTGATVIGFTAQDPALIASPGNPVPFQRAYVTEETQYRAIQTAIAMRTETPIPTYIYTMGLGPDMAPSTQAFLAQLANDPSYSTFINTQPAGQFFPILSCPGSACTAELNSAFQVIASKILLRLTQ